MGAVVDVESFAWSPYGKSRGNGTQYVELLELLGLDLGTLSGLQKFEGPDPAFWCAHGYAVCNPDPRGAYNSEGDIRWWSRYEGHDYHDLIKWLGVQDWCTGKVGTTGNSWLAISQWFAAAEQPPHLAAIAPWEGMSDIYRDFIMRGGIPDFPFPRTLATSLVGKNRREDLAADPATRSDSQRAEARTLTAVAAARPSAARRTAG